MYVDVYNIYASLYSILYLKPLRKLLYKDLKKLFQINVSVDVGPVQTFNNETNVYFSQLNYQWK